MFIALVRVHQSTDLANLQTSACFLLLNSESLPSNPISAYLILSNPCISLIFTFEKLGTACQVYKSCSCENVPAVNTTMLNNVTYYGIKDSNVNSSLKAVGTYSKQSISLLCKRKSNSAF